MKAIVYHQFRGPVSVERVDDPRPAPDGALIAVRATGLCRSDWHGWQGHDADVQTLPHVPGQNSQAKWSRSATTCSAGGPAIA